MLGQEGARPFKTGTEDAFVGRMGGVFEFGRPRGRGCDVAEDAAPESGQSRYELNQNSNQQNSS